MQLFLGLPGNNNNKTPNLNRGKNISTSQNNKKRRLEEEGNTSRGKKVKAHPENTSQNVRKKVKAHRRSTTLTVKTSPKLISEKKVINLTKKYESLIGKNTHITKPVMSILTGIDKIQEGRNQLIDKLEGLANFYEPIDLKGTQSQPIRNCIELLKKMENVDPFAISIGDAIKFADDVKNALDRIQYSGNLKLTTQFKKELGALITGLNTIKENLENLNPDNISRRITNKQKELDKNSRLVRALAIWGAVLTIGGILATAAVIVAGVLVNPLILLALEGSIAMLAGGCTCIGFAIGTNDRKEIEKELNDLKKHQEALNLFLDELKNLKETTDTPQKPEILNDKNSLLGIKEPSEKEKQKIAAENFLKQFNEEMANLENN